MTKYLVTYYGSESGWVSTTQDFGIVEADSEEAACELVALREVPHDEPISRLSRQTTRASFRMYLTATPVTMSATQGKSAGHVRAFTRHADYG